MRTQGRGYLCSDGDVSECQVALIEASIEDLLQQINGELLADGKVDEVDKDGLLSTLPQRIIGIGTSMRNIWQGNLPKPVKAMDEVLTLTNFEELLAESPTEFSGVSLPMGIYYQDLSPVFVDLRSDGPFWTITGGRQSGKSTAMLGMVYHLQKRYPQRSQVTLMPFRRGPLGKIQNSGQMALVVNPEQQIATLNAFTDEVRAREDVMHVLLMDDIGVLFSGGNTTLIQAINQLGDQLNMTAQDNFMVVIADLYSNLKSPQTYSSSFMKLFQQSQAGIFFSMDDSDMQWFNTRISLHYKKTLKWLPGRGFYVNKGNAEYIQTPLVTPEDIY